MVNSAALPQATVPVGLARSRFQGEVELYLTSGSTITLQLVSGLIGSATLLSGGVGAALMIIRLS